ncbi:MAG: hypothetical protein AABY22_00180 [Nanoarchaeota archaeon]
MRKINKRAQFYLIAAIVIILIVMGFYGVKNVIRSNANSERIYDLKNELDIESASVVDYGLYNNEDTKELLDDFTSKYSDFAGQGKNLYFVFGDENQIIVKGREDILTGSIGVQIGGATTTIPVFVKKDFKENLIRSGNEVKVIIDSQEFIFQLNPGQNFYFVIEQNINEEKQVVKG